MRSCSSIGTNMMSRSPEPSRLVRQRKRSTRRAACRRRHDPADHERLVKNRVRRRRSYGRSRRGSRPTCRSRSRCRARRKRPVGSESHGAHVLLGLPQHDVRPERRREQQPAASGAQHRAACEARARRARAPRRPRRQRARPSPPRSRTSRTSPSASARPPRDPGDQSRRRPSRPAQPGGGASGIAKVSSTLGPERRVQPKWREGEHQPGGDRAREPAAVSAYRKAVVAHKTKEPSVRD
jgi:hypothetical protein